MKALIISPKNNTIYTTNKIPLELYTDPEAKKVVVKVNDKAVYSHKLTKEGYFADQLSLAPNGIEDMELAFEFYDKDDKIIKTESILILDSSTAFELPKLSIEVTPAGDLNAATNASIKTKIEARKNFKIKDDLKVSFNTHLGPGLLSPFSCCIHLSAPDQACTAALAPGQQSLYPMFCSSPEGNTDHCNPC